MKKEKNHLSISSTQYRKGEHVLVYIHIPPFILQQKYNQ